MTALDDWNRLPAPDALAPVLAWCGSRAFADAVVRQRPFADMDALLATADSIWWSLREGDWLEAFACHPRIGESAASSPRPFSAWSAEEQSTAHSGANSVLDSISERNREYEARHGFIYIVCATGKSAGELLAILDSRIGNPTEHEIKEAAEQQRQITRIRIGKWLTQ